MEFSWSSFILELINFLVLLWILKHFFYAPIQRAILQRQRKVQENLDTAKQLRDEAQLLQVKYENRLQEWEIEKGEKKASFQQELDEWKSQKLVQFEKKMEKEKEKIHSREMQVISSTIKKNAQEAMRISGQFCAKFLAYFASEDLEEKMVDKIIGDLEHLSVEQIESLTNAAQTTSDLIVESAYPLNGQKKENLTEAIQKILNMKAAITFIEDPRLLAGLNIKVGLLSLQANLQSELIFFTEIERDNDVVR